MDILIFPQDFVKIVVEIIEKVGIYEFQNEFGFGRTHEKFS
jgi:hypothetical protein